MRSRYLMIIFAVTILAGLGLKLRAAKIPAEEKNRMVASSGEKAESRAPEAQGKSVEQSLEGSRNSIGSNKSSRSEKHEVWKEFKYMQELMSYASLSEKVLLSEKDQKIRNQLFEDVDFLKSLQILLKTPPVDNESRIRQSLALDFVFEALKTDLKEQATEILQSVVEDSTLESSLVSLQDRKALAEVKAEVLYNWSASVSSSEVNIQGLLPGPVSQKIWANVKMQQKRNLAESSSLEVNH